MEQNNRKIHQILAHLAGAATAAAEGVTDVVQAAGHAVGEKYDVLKLNLELTRLQDDQTKLFADIGKTMFLIQNGNMAQPGATAEGEMIDAQQTVDRLLLQADQKQQEMDNIIRRLRKLDGSRVCTACGKVNPAQHSYCSACGAPVSPDF